MNSEALGQNVNETEQETEQKLEQETQQEMWLFGPPSPIRVAGYVVMDPLELPSQLRDVHVMRLAYRNHWRRWSTRDDARLRSWLAVGLGWDVLVRILGRTKDAIQQRAWKFGWSKRE